MRRALSDFEGPRRACVRGKSVRWEFDPIAGPEGS